MLYASARDIISFKMGGWLTLSTCTVPHTFTFKLPHYHSYDGIRKNSVPVKVSTAPRPAVSDSMENCAKVNSLLGMVRVTSEQLCEGPLTEASRLEAD